MSRRSNLILATVSALACLAPATPDHGGPASRPTGLQVQIAVPQRTIGLAYDEGRQLQVVLTNTSNEPEPILDDWNSFGYFNLTMEYVLPDGSKHAMSKQPQKWEKNFPTSTTIGPGQCIVRNVSFDPKVWSGLPEVFDRRGVTFTAVWRQTQPDRSIEPPVWQGTARSLPVTVRLEQDGERLRVANR